MYGKDAINAAADEIISKINSLREVYLEDAEEDPESFAGYDAKIVYVWLAESLF